MGGPERSQYIQSMKMTECNKNAKALKLHSVILLFSRLYAVIAFLQRLIVILTVVFFIECTYYAHILNQRSQISQNRAFVFEFKSLPVLTVFQIQYLSLTVFSGFRFEN